jgi:hypothetical protein
MVKKARFRPAISADAYVDAPNRALLIGSYSPGQSAEKAAARRRSRRFILRLRRERTVELSQRHPSIGVMLPPAAGVFLLDNDIRRSIGPTSWRTGLLVSAAPSEGGRPIRGGSSGERGRGDNGSRPRVGRARRMLMRADEVIE